MAGVDLESASSISQLYGMSTLDLEDSSTYSPGDWIGRGKTFSYADLPPSVVKTYQDVMKLPTHLRTDLIPPASTPISDFVNISLPSPDQDLLHTKVEGWFSSDPPDSEVDALPERPLLPARLLQLLLEAAPQAWLDGRLSVLDSRYKDSSRYPLYAITLWRDLASVATAQRQWEECVAWVSNLIRDVKYTPISKDLRAARGELLTLPWDATIRMGKVTTSTSTLARLLGARWLCDDLIELMLEDIVARQRVEGRAGGGGEVIGGIAVMVELKRAVRNKEFNRNLPFLHQIERAVKAKTCRSLCIRKNHFLVSLAEVLVCAREIGRPREMLSEALEHLWAPSRIPPNTRALLRTQDSWGLEGFAWIIC